ncbi:MAG: hypothetical protein ACRC67_01360 [Inquilinus sp.]|uniref:hypothetical protein n=1 Tax=Inquilinus sp. TaxID=1932117 RepID=UPI003F38396C
MRGLARSLTMAMAGGLTVFLAEPAWAACKYVTDPDWLRVHAGAEGALVAEVDGLGVAVSAQQTTNLQVLSSIIAVLTRQKALDGDRDATATRSAAEGLAAAVGEMDRRQALAKVVEDYGPAGRALDPCVTAVKGAALATGITSWESRAETIVSQGMATGKIDSVLPVSLEDAARARIQGWTPAASTAGTLLDPAAPAEAKDRVMAAIAGMPPTAPMASSTGAGQAAAIVEGARIRAIRGPLVRALGAVRAAAEPGGLSGVEAAGATSVIGSLDWVISRYGAGQENEDWRVGLVTLGDRGLLQEEARLDAVLLDLDRLDGEIDRLEAATFAAGLAGGIR